MKAPRMLVGGLVVKPAVIREYARVTVAGHARTLAALAPGKSTKNCEKCGRSCARRRRWCRRCRPAVARERKRLWWRRWQSRRRCLECQGPLKIGSRGGYCRKCLRAAAERLASIGSRRVP